MISETEPELQLKIGDRFSKTSIRSLREISRELLIYTAKKVGIQIFDVECILKETIEVFVHLNSLGKTVRLPHGLMGIVIMPEVAEFSTMGIGSKLFPNERLITSAFNKEMERWGYENIPSGRVNRLLSKKLCVPKCATKIKMANETGILRYSHFKNHRELGE